MQTRDLSEAKSPNIYQKILLIMSELSYIEKGSKTVNGQYRFVSHDQVTEKLQGLLVKYQVTPISTVKEITQDNNRTTVKMAIVFVNAEDPSDHFTIEYPGYGIDSGDKGPGKAISYAYKYAMLKTFNIATGDDPDKQANASYEPAKCVEFDSMIPADATPKDISKIKRFLEERSAVFGRHVEEMKREAVKRMPEFLDAVKKWNPKKDAVE